MRIDSLLFSFSGVFLHQTVSSPPSAFKLAIICNIELLVLAQAFGKRAFYEHFLHSDKVSRSNIYGGRYCRQLAYELRARHNQNVVKHSLLRIPVVCVGYCAQSAPAAGIDIAASNKMSIQVNAIIASSNMPNQTKHIPASHPSSFFGAHTADPTPRPFPFPSRSLPGRPKTVNSDETRPALKEVDPILVRLRVDGIAAVRKSARQFRELVRHLHGRRQLDGPGPIGVRVRQRPR